jgi:hypothetical protein
MKPGLLIIILIFGLTGSLYSNCAPDSKLPSKYLPSDRSYVVPDLPPASPDPEVKQPGSIGRLRPQGRHFVYPDGQVFPWRFVSFFGGIDLIADGKTTEADTKLLWFKTQGVTGVRVFLMMGNAADTVSSLFDLSPAEGLRALPAFLDLALKHGLYVEVVALANTKSEWAAWYPSQTPAYLSELGRIASLYDNTLVELANEAIHPTQADDLYTRLEGWRSLIPASVPVATGISNEDYYFDDAAFPTRALADYITVHSERNDGDNGWRVVRHVRELGDISSKFAKPVVSDEPIGADETDRPGSRVADPAKHFGLSIVPRIADLAGTTFHYEGGLRYDVPMNNQLACFLAWRFGATLIPANQFLTYFNANNNGTWPTSPVGNFNFQTDGRMNSAVRAYSGVLGTSQKGYVVIVGKAGDPGVVFANGWAPGNRLEYYPGMEVIAIGQNGTVAPILSGMPAPTPVPVPAECLGGSYGFMRNGWATQSECQAKVQEGGASTQCVFSNGCWIAQ